MLDGFVSAAEALDLDALAARFATRAAFHDETGTTSRENLAELHAAGLLALTADPAHGGGGAGLAETARVIGRVAEGDPSTALILSMQYLQHAAILRSGRWPAEVAAEVARSAVAEGALINALRVEPALGTPARGGLPATVARRTSAGWRVSGRKIYSTGCTVLRWGAVWARTDEETPRVGAFLVPLAADGVTIEKSWNQLGMRATESHTVVLDEVAIPHAYAVDVRTEQEWQAPDAVHSVWNNVLIGALYDGVARAARRWLLDFLRARAPGNLGAPLATLPRFHQIVGEIDALLLTNRLVIDAASAADTPGVSGTLGPGEGSLVKQVVTENAIRAVERAVASIGNPALSRDNPLERHYRDVLCARIHTPQGDAALAFAGRLSLGV